MLYCTEVVNSSLNNSKRLFFTDFSKNNQKIVIFFLTFI
jgi:hypothetical protein